MGPPHTRLMDFKRNVNGKMLRCGYTTGACAAAAAKAGAIFLFSKAPVSKVTLNTPKGIPLTLDVLTIGRKDGQAICAVKKDSGDDPDITNGILVYAAVSEIKAASEIKGKAVRPENPLESGESPGLRKNLRPGKIQDSGESPESRKSPKHEESQESEKSLGLGEALEPENPFFEEEAGRNSPSVVIEGGQGIGKVTRPGLNQPIGASAINSVPRQMITEAVSEVCRQYKYSGSLKVIISIPEGTELAKRTFNGRIGIEGGLSIIGTTGILEPMSNQALIDTIRLEICQLAASGHKHILLTPGNYGADFARKRLGLHLECHVRCSNFIGEAIDCCAEQGFTGILLVGHIGKLVKLGIGVTNTHSSFGDGRMETLIACALKAGGNLELLRVLSDCLTTDEALLHLKSAGILEDAMKILGTRIQDCLERRTPEQVQIEFVCFTNEESLPRPLCESSGAEAFMLSMDKNAHS